MTAPWSDPLVVSRTPLLTVLLLEGANVQQLARMWTEHSAEGQSLGGWLSVNAALLLWCNFYRVCCPHERTAFWCTVLGVAMNLAVVLTVAYLRYLA